MEANTLPTNIRKDVDKLTKTPWTTVAEADKAADYIRDLRYQAGQLGLLTDEEVAMKRTIDAKLALEANALAEAKVVEAELKPVFIAFTQDETERRNATLPVSKHKKNVTGKGWNCQLKDKPGTLQVSDSELAVKHIEKAEPLAIKIVKTVDVAKISQAFIAKLTGMNPNRRSALGFLLTPKIPDGNTTVKIDSLDEQ